MRPILTARGQDGRAWASALADPAWEYRADLIKRDHGATVHRARLVGTDVIVKTWRLSTAARLKSILRASRAFRHWRAARWLDRKGFRTAACLALLRGERDADPVEILVMEALPGKSLLQHLADADLRPAQQHAVARALGRDLVRLDHAGRYNRDGKPSNLFILPHPAAAPPVAVIDCVAIRRYLLCTDDAAGADSAARLLIEPRHLGLHIRRTLLMAGLRGMREQLESTRGTIARDQWRLLRRRQWEETARRVAAHRKPPPTINPLAPAPVS